MVCPYSNSKNEFCNHLILWFDQYLGDKYTKGIGPFGQYKQIFLSGGDCYALRCAYLHEGRDEITDQKCQRVLNNFRFTTDSSHRNYFNNGVNTTLQLQVESFCKEICDGVEQWLKNVISNQTVQNKMSKMLKIHDSIFTKNNTGYHIP